MESISQYHNHSTQELFELLAVSTEITASYIKDAADILVELKARKQHHPLMRSALLRYYVDIASGKLSAKAVFVLGGLPNVINKLKGLAIEEQNRIADGGTLPVMEPVKGGLKLVEKPVLRLDKFQLERVFADGRIRTTTEQEIYYKQQAGRTVASKPQPPAGLRDRVWAAPDRGILIIGTMHVTPEELIKPLAELGWVVTPKIEENAA